jgi:hypothetical protein
VEEDHVTSDFKAEYPLMTYLVKGQLLNVAPEATVFRLKGSALPLVRRPEP